MPCLAIGVRFHEGRYHGRPQGGADWPPSAARLFQALVAGAARGETLAEEDKSAFAWLECLAPPVIAAPPMRAGQGFRNFVPNNDLDAVGGDLKRLGEIRAPKLIRPILFDAETPLLYLWTFDDSPEAQANVRQVCGIVERLYQLGRGVDMAWAWGEIIAAEDAEARLAMHGGVVYRPAQAGAGAILAVPINGSLDSLTERHNETRRRFQTLYEAKPTKKEPDRRVAVGQIFAQPLKPRFGQAAYNSPPVRLLFDIRSTGVRNAEPEFAPWPLTRAVELVTAVRDSAASRLKQHRSAALIERVLIGRDATEADKAARVRIAPLPSIGHAHADHAIRRILVEVPPNCPLAIADIRWGFSVEFAADNQTGEFISELVPAGDDSMLDHYGVDNPARVWRTVTPAALPHGATRWRMQPSRLHHSAKPIGAPERIAEENRAAAAVVQALRHAGVGATITDMRVQREPFARHGARAEVFVPGTRFTKEGLWHVEITFAQSVGGPLIIGDGRYLGLGLLEPVSHARSDVVVFQLAAAEPRVATGDRIAFLSAVRRALMSLSRRSDGSVPRLFSGHEADGAPAQSGRHEHLFLSTADFNGDGYIDALIVSAPWRCDHSVRPAPGDATLLDRVVTSLEVVRAGKLGIISLAMDAAGSDDGRLVGPAHIWDSHTCYSPTRPVRKGDDPVDVLRRDASAECRRRGLPMPVIELLSCSSDIGHRVTARLRLSFAAAVKGPLILGRDSHQGGGLFLAST